MQASATQCVKRINPASVHLDESFLLKVDSEKEVAHQYFELYKHRLQRLRPVLEAVARQKWGDVPICQRILDCQTANASEVVIIGTCFKDQKKKFNPLEVIDDDDDYEDKKADETSHAALIGVNVSDSDFLVLEDEIGSLKVAGDCMDRDRLLTGITLAVRGCINQSSGVFVASDFSLCGLPPISPLPPSVSSDGEDKYVALVSGLEMARLDEAHSQALQLLFNYLGGFVGDAAKDGLAAQVCRVLLVGNIIHEELPDEDTNIFYDTGFKKKEQQKIAALDSRLKELDAWTAQLAASVAVDVMPGSHDPADELLPQQPFHRCLFPLSAQLGSFRRVTNPYSVRLDGRLLLGTAGQNFLDMMKHSRCDMIECMRLSLRSRIIAPTAPDTLSCFPFRANDPFLIGECPHVYFSGNNEAFRCESVEHADGCKVCLVQVPSFVKTRQIVLLNLKTMQPQLVQIAPVSTAATTTTDSTDTDTPTATA